MFRPAIAVALAITALAVLPSMASAARPALTAHAANVEAQRSLDANTSLWNEEQAFALENPALEVAPEPTITDATLEGCEAIGRYRAECPFVMALSDGTEEGGVLDVTIGPRGRVRAYWPESQA